MSLTLRLSTDDRKELKACIALMGEATASKTLVRMLHEYRALRDERDALREALADARHSVRIRNSAIERWQAASAVLRDFDTGSGF